MKGFSCLVVSLVFVLFVNLCVFAAPVTLSLDYNAYANASTFAYIGIIGPEGDPEVKATWEAFDADSYYCANGPSGTSVSAYSSSTAYIDAGEQWVDEVDPMTGDPMLILIPVDHTQTSTINSSVGAQIVNGNEVKFTSSITFSSDHEYWPDTPEMPTGESLGGGWTYLLGTLEMGTDDQGGYAEGAAFSLDFSAAVSGDVEPKPWLWDWSVEIFRGEDLITTLQDGNVSQNLEVFAGETLTYKFSHVPEPATLILLSLGGLLLIRDSRA